MRLLLVLISSISLACAQGDAGALIQHLTAQLTPKLEADLNTLQAAIFDYDGTYSASLNLLPLISTVKDDTYACTTWTMSIANAVANGNSSTYDADSYTYDAMMHYRRHLILYEVVDQHKVTLATQSAVVTDLIELQQQTVDLYTIISSFVPDKSKSTFYDALSTLQTELAAITLYGNSSSATTGSTSTSPNAGLNGTTYAAHLSNIMSDFMNATLEIGNQSTAVLNVLTNLDSVHFPQFITELTAITGSSIDSATSIDLASDGAELYNAYVNVVESFIRSSDYMFENNRILAIAIGFHQKIVTYLKAIQGIAPSTYRDQYVSMIAMLEVYGEIAQASQTARYPNSIDSLPTAGVFTLWTGDNRALQVNDDHTIGFGTATPFHQDQYRLVDAFNRFVYSNASIVATQESIPDYGYTQNWTYQYGLIRVTISNQIMQFFECAVGNATQLFTGLQTDPSMLKCDQVFITARST